MSDLDEDPRRQPVAHGVFEADDAAREPLLIDQFQRDPDAVARGPPAATNENRAPGTRRAAAVRWPVGRFGIAGWV